MQELVLNLHIHTSFSDGHALHAEIAQAALESNLDAIIFTDHNVLVSGLDNYYQKGRRKVLLIFAEEIHDQARQPQKNHMLVIGANKELAPFASNPQRLIDRAKQWNGLTFLAHPYEDALPSFGEGDISWVDWKVDGFTGLELWNSMSEFKSAIKNKLQAICFAFFPQFIFQGPAPLTMRKWDELLNSGKMIVGVGGSDSHALPMHMGPLSRTIFPYAFLFQTVNTHILTPTPLTGESAIDQKMVIDALRQGHAFIGYDLPASTRGFRFTANARDGIYSMGDRISPQSGVTFQIRLPFKTECRFLKNGHVIKKWLDKEFCTYITSEPGVYRVEVYIHYLGKDRAWIISNPIYVKAP